MIAQDILKEYRDFGRYLDQIRRAKKITYQVLELNGVSSRTFQRIKKGDADITLSDLSILAEILCLSPLEINLMAENCSFTVRYRKQFVSALEKKDFQEARRVFKNFKEYYDSSSFTLGKDSVLYMMYGLSLIYDPNPVITKKEIQDIETKIISQLEKVELYTLFDLEFLALQNLLGLQKIDISLVLEILATVDITMVDPRTQSVVEQFIKNMILGTIKSGGGQVLFQLFKIIQELKVSENAWSILFLKKITKEVENQYLYPENEKNSVFLSEQRAALNVILPIAHAQSWIGFINEIEEEMEKYRNKINKL